MNNSARHFPIVLTFGTFVRYETPETTEFGKSTLVENPRWQTAGQSTKLPSVIDPTAFQLILFRN